MAEGTPNPWPTVGKLALALLATGILAAGLLLPYVGGLGLAARHEASKFLDTDCKLIETPPPRKTTLYASDGKTEIATLFVQDRQPVALSKIPHPLIDALVATEDRRFYSHHGVDMRGLIRSAVSTSGGDTQGGSTLTMQYVKQVRYYQAGSDVAKQQAAIDQNLNRKIEDAKCAIYLENTKHESKDTILDNYLNIAFFGENSYGVETAAQTYFNKHVEQLTLPESAMLVGLLRAPTEYDPFKNPEAAKSRRNQVLQNLVDVHKLSQAEADRLGKTPVTLATTKAPIVREGCANAPKTILNAGFFCDYAVRWLTTIGGITDTALTTGGLKIVTTLDAKLQNSVQSHLSATIPASSAMTSVMPIVDPKTGNVLAMATSKQYGQKANSKDNTHTVLPIFTSYTAQGASTYKLFPLLTALQTGVPSNYSIYTPITNQQPLPNQPASSPGYRPLNCGTDNPVQNGDALESYSNNESLLSATVKSSNTFFVGLVDQMYQCDLKPVVDMAKKLGMKGLNEPSGDQQFDVADSIINYQRPGELVLGDVGTSPLELAGAYAAVANGGKFNSPSPIQSITDPTKPEGQQSVKVLRPPAVPVVSPQVAAQAVQILAGDTVAPGTSAGPFQSWYGANPGKVVAGKTGTSVAVVGGKETDQNAALWFVGMTPNLVATSALINLDHPNAPATGLPGVTNPAVSAYGAYASGVWLSALSPYLGAAPAWSWTSPNAVPGSPVPVLTNLSLDQAKQRLQAAGFKLAQFAQGKVQCSSRVPAQQVAFYAPQIAPPGSTITVCLSSGLPLLTAPQPKPTNTPRPGATSSTGAQGGNNGGGNNGRPGGGRTVTVTVPPNH